MTATMANFAFNPATITAKVGDVVTWTNNDTTAHTATVKSDETCTTENLASGATGEHRVQRRRLIRRSSARSTRT